MLRVTFKDQSTKNSFSDRFPNLCTNVDGTDDKLDIPLNLLQFAKLDDNALDYDDLESNEVREYIVKGDPTKFSKIAEVEQDLGNGFYLVKTHEGTILGDFVDSIEHNGPAMGFSGNTSTMHDMNVATPDIDPTSSDAQWARLRVASRYRPLLKTFNTHEMTFLSKPELYIMDSGIDFSHPEFNVEGLETENFYKLSCFESFDDDLGHGTAVASMAVGKNLGVASHCKLISIKVGGLNHNANLIEIGQAIDALVQRASANPMVTRIVNMSWGVARSAWLDAKVQSLIDLGITVVCAAGNSGISVEDISPAGLDTVITVGSIDKYDIPSGFNNISPSDAGLTTGHGLSLDIFAPGEHVYVAMHNLHYGITSGTSFAAPLVAGVATTIASLNKSMVPYNELKTMILDTATKDALLFEDNKFSENQNNLVYLITSDSAATYKATNIVTYLGAHNNEEPLVVNLNSAVTTTDFANLYPNDPVVWSYRFVDPSLETTYSKFFSLDSTTGILTISKPTDSLPEETKLKMVEFIATATTSRIKADSGVIFFFDTNQLYKDTIASDITLALTGVNSISFYATWFIAIK